MSPGQGISTGSRYVSCAEAFKNATRVYLRMDVTVNTGAGV